VSALLPAGLIELISIGIDKICQGQKVCLRTCHCPTAEMLSAHLVHTYLSYKSNDIVRSAPHPHSQYAVHSAANTHQATASLIAAYIALILAKLIRAEHPGPAP
jgi:hypothetical protein